MSKNPFRFALAQLVMYAVFAAITGWLLIQLQQRLDLGLSDELLIILFPPILLAAIYARRAAYYGMVAIALAVCVWVLLSVVDTFPASFHTLAIFTISFVVAGEFFRHLYNARKKVEYELLLAQSELESRVKERTEELAQSNQRLINEIAEREQTEKALEQAKIEADSANQAKSRFLANISHEIRTPLHGIVGMSDLIGNTQLTEEQKEYLEILNRSSKALLALINELLDFSKIEAGKVTLESIPFSLTALVLERVEVFLPEAKKKNLRLERFIEPNTPDRLLGDPYRVAQVINNLLSNAIKFTNTGAITIFVREQEPGKDAGLFYFQIADQGIGIPAEKHKSIFNAFEQADGATTRQFGGTGLGLPISSQLVELMGGEMWLDSQPGKGSVFHFTLRLLYSEGAADAVAPIPGQPMPHAAAPHPPKKLRVLVIEDNAINRKIMDKMLGKRGHHVETAGNGLAGYERLVESEFDLVVMDLQMPIMDGFEATALIREWNRENGTHTPIIALTAHAMETDKEKCLEAGMDRYLSKPVHSDSLYATIASLFDERQHG